MPRKSSSSRTISSRTNSSAATGNIQRAVVEFNPDYTHIKRDLKRIGILTASFFGLMIVLALTMQFWLPFVMR